MIVFCAADLIWATRIKSTADSLGIPCRPVRNPEMLQERLADSPVRSLIVDLEAGPVGLELIGMARTKGGIHILGFGPHVATDLFAAAKGAGANAVLARGAFNARLPQILQDLASDPGVIRDQLSE